MADYSFGGTDEENAELKKLNAEVVSSPQGAVPLDSQAFINISTARGA